MANEEEKKQAALVFKTLCAMLDEDEWHYQKDEENFTLNCGAQGDDLPMQITVRVDAGRKLVMLYSEMPFAISEDRRTALAIAVSKANYGMVDGCFDYDFLTGKIVFRMTATYRDSLIGKGLFKYMMYCSCATIDKYNDKFLMVAKSNMTNEQINAFIE